MSVIGDRIKSIRKSRGYTQIALAEKVNIANSVLAEIEAGRRTPSKELAKRLAIFLKEPIETFLLEDLSEIPTANNTVSTADVLAIADIVTEFFNKNGGTITPEQRLALIDHFYQQHITDESEIRKILSFMHAVNSESNIRN